MNWEETWKKETVERLDNIRVATNALHGAMRCIRESCKLCGICDLTEATCDVAKSYKKIENAKEELESFQSRLENSVR